MQVLEGAQFDEIIGTCDVFSAPKGMFFGVHGVRFQGANLRKASFRGAKLAGDFTNAELNEIDFYRSGAVRQSYAEK